MYLPAVIPYHAVRAVEASLDKALPFSSRDLDYADAPVAEIEARASEDPSTVLDSITRSVEAVKEVEVEQPSPVKKRGGRVGGYTNSCTIM